MSYRVLVVDDDKNMCSWIEEGLGRRKFKTTSRGSAEEAFALLATEEFDVVVTDINMPRLKGTELCERIILNHPEVPVVLITAFGSFDTAIAAIRAGAYDFLTKPFKIDELALTIEHAAQQRALREEVKRLRRAVTESQTFDEIVGSSPAMKKVFELLERVAETDTTVLVTGETGTGKELIARALHKRGRRKAAPFLAINCAALPEPLLESELFGHAKGAFTDAKAARTGLFVQATGGTLFLDEVGEMPPGMQVKLLRALQERVVRPVGGDAEVPFDVRIVAATNQNLEKAVSAGTFREDLFYRLNVIQLELPPLRARGNDVLLLSQRFVEHFAARASKKVLGLSSGAAEKLLGYSWPGNVRELQNCVERAVALTRQEQLTVEDLPEKIRDYKAAHVFVASNDPAELAPMDEVERRYILHVLEATGGNKRHAARVLGFDRKTLYRKLERYGVSPAGPPEED
jgi:two-component system response regulator HydG